VDLELEFQLVARTAGAVVTATIGRLAAQPLALLVAAPPCSRRCFELTGFSREASLFASFVIIKPHIAN
jgi:hypothetical protein